MIGFSLADLLVHQYPNSGVVGEPEGKTEAAVTMRIPGRIEIYNQDGELLLSSLKIYT
jgi:hypothetical protein